MVAHWRGWLGRSVLAIVAAALIATDASAAWLGFRNDLKHPVVIRCSPDKQRQAIPHRLHPGEVLWEWVADGSPRRVVVCDDRQSRQVLVDFRTSDAIGKDLFYVIKPPSVSASGKRTMEVVKIEPLQPTVGKR